MTEDLDDLMCPHSAAGRPERFPAKACILAGECGSYRPAIADGGFLDRALSVVIWINTALLAATALSRWFV